MSRKLRTYRRGSLGAGASDGRAGRKRKWFGQRNTRLLRRQPVDHTVCGFSPAAEKSLLQHNTSLNFIYQSDPGLPGGQPFVSVIDAVPGDGFNPIWEEVQITFTAGHTPRQLFSDTEVEAAFDAGEITLTSRAKSIGARWLGRSTSLSPY